MKKSLALFACFLFTGVLTGVPAEGTAQTKDSPPEAEQKKQLFESKCQQCHSLERVKEAHLSRDKAKVIVERMSQKPGANISKGEAESIYEYLGNYFIIPPSPPVAPAPIQ